MVGMDRGSLCPGCSPSGATENVVMNYVFTTPAGGIPSPLPLIIPKTLVEAPSASLRSIIISNLELEGITLKLGEIRFWKTRIPLNAEVAVNEWQSWLDQAANNGTKAFEAMPFTKPILSSLQESTFDDSLVHLFVTNGEAPYHSSLDKPAAAIEPTTRQEVVIGSYCTEYRAGREDWREVREAERHSKVIKIPISEDTDLPGDPAYLASSTPAIILGIRQIDIGSGDSEIQLMSHVSNGHPDSFTVHLDSFGRTSLYHACVDWMAVYPPYFDSARRVQWGTIDSQAIHPRKLGRRTTTHRIQFRQSYEVPPFVFICLSGFTIGGHGSNHWDIRTFTTNIERESFEVYIEKTRDWERDVHEVVGQARVSWIAFPRARIVGMEMACGEFNLSDGLRTEKDNGHTVEWRGEAKFAKEFAYPPRAFVALKCLDAAKPWNIRFFLDIEQVTSERIAWRATKWDDTTIHSATIAFLAVAIRD